jgi:predicted house-cleaning noncanonical NTP pyrophosphatase (MazG superfamily)
MPTYDKLVRDKIPEIIAEQGKICEFYIANKEEYGRRLIEKMREEISEFEEDPSIEELADIYEVFLGILQHQDIRISDVVFMANRKASTRGKFERGIILKSVQDPSPSHI